MPFARRPSRRGFTLIEVMIALAIVVALVGVAMPMIRAGGPEARLESTASRIREMVSHARERSMRSGTPWIVNVGKDAAGAWTVKASPLHDDEPEAEEEPAAIADDWLLLMPDGSSVELHELTLTTDRSRALKVRASRATSAISTQWIEAPAPSEERR